MDTFLSILAAVGVVAGIGLVAGAILVIASKFMEVKTDPRADELRECLPGANCGACGYTGCDGYAKALASDTGVATNLCVPGADAVSRRISEILGVEFADVVEQVAFVKCHGDCEKTRVQYTYEGLQSCAAARMLYNGDWECDVGCLGHGDCAAVCPEGAICLEDGLARVNPRKCIGCGLCTKACPQHLIELFPDVKRAAVTCSNHDAGGATHKKCLNGCIACRKCEKNCPTGAVTVVNNLATINYDLCSNCGMCAEVCPVQCIRIADNSGKHRFPEVAE